MEAIREIQQPKNGKVTIDLPEEMSKSPVELIVFPVDEKIGSHKKFDPLKYFGVAKSNLSDGELGANIR